jgi:hypothetical protein
MCNPQTLWYFILSCIHSLVGNVTHCEQAAPKRAHLDGPRAIFALKQVRYLRKRLQRCKRIVNTPTIRYSQIAGQRGANLVAELRKLMPSGVAQMQCDDGHEMDQIVEPLNPEMLPPGTRVPEKLRHLSTVSPCSGVHEVVGGNILRAVVRDSVSKVALSVSAKKGFANLGIPH